MSRNLGDAFVRVRPDTRSFGSELSRDTGRSMAVAGRASGAAYAASFEQNTSAKMSSGLKRVAVAAAGVFASRQVLSGAKALVDRASDLSETGNKIDVVFGKASGRVEAFSKRTLTSLGQTQQSALDAAATFGVFGKAAGLNDRENAKFSKSLVQLSSDMASFSNTTPEEAIDALGAALRGESEPIRRYGVLLDDATLRNRALKLGLIDSTKTALTPANKVLAAQAEIMEQTKDAQGDFARTSGGFANQQRIVAAQTETLKTKLGQGLLPVFAAGSRLLSSKVLPPLIDLADRYVPRAAKAIEGWINHADPSAMLDRIGDTLKKVDWSSASSGASSMSDALKNVDWTKAAASTRDIADSTRELAPVAKDLGSQLPTLNDLLTVTGEVMAFAADHTDTLQKLLPYLAAGFVAVKVGQLAANIAAAASLPMKIADIIATRAQTKAMKEFVAIQRTATGSTAAGTIAQAASNTATSTSTRLTMRERAAKIASAVATRVVSAATKAWTLVMKGLNLVMRMNPIGLVITAIALLAAGVVIAYKKSETFRRIVQGAWDGIKQAASFAWNRVLKPIFGFLVNSVTKQLDVFRRFGRVIGALWDGVKTKSRDAAIWVVDKVLGMAEGMLKAIEKAFGWAPKIGPKIRDALEKVRGFRDDVNAINDGIKDENVRISLTTVRSAANKNEGQLNRSNRSNATGGAGMIPSRVVTHASTRHAMGGASPMPAIGRSLRGARANARLAQSDAHGIAMEAAERIQGQMRKQAAKAAKAGLGAAGPAGRVLPRGSYRIGMPYLGYPGHYGADYPAATGTPVYSPWAGRVTAAYDLPGSNPYNGTPYRSYGRVVKISHPNGLSTLYAHLSSRIGHTGPIAAGAMIGRVGMNGNATGPHLHFEARRGGQVFNPASLGLFDRGGVARGRGVMIKDIIKPERTLDPRTTVAFEELVDLLKSGKAGAGVGARIDVHDRSGDPVRTAIETARRLAWMGGA